MHYINSLLDNAADNFGIFLFMFAFFMPLFTITYIAERIPTKKR